MSFSQVTLSQAELDTVLAALRLYQSEPQLPDEIREIAEANGDPGLCPEEIDELCERLNFAPEVEVPAPVGA